VGFERCHVLDRQLAEALTQSVQTNSRRSVGNSKLLGNVAQGHVPADSDHHDRLIAIESTGGFLGELRDRRAEWRRSLSIGGLSGVDTILRVALGHDSLARLPKFQISASTGTQLPLCISVTISSSIAKSGDEVSSQVPRSDVVLHQMQHHIIE